MANVMGNLIGITLNFYIALGTMTILAILILLMKEYGLSFHFLKLSLLYFVNIL